MKTLIDGFQVSSRSYYYLLDFNENDGWKYIITNFNKYSLKDLTQEEYKILFRYATDDDLFNNFTHL